MHHAYIIVQGQSNEPSMHAGESNWVVEGKRCIQMDIVEKRIQKPPPTIIDQHKLSQYSFIYLHVKR